MAKHKTYTLIYTIASEFFAKNGYVGTIMGELAAKCSVNKASIYYHFKDKENLYNVVITTHLENLLKAVLPNAEKALLPQEKLEAFILNYAKHINKAPVLASLMMREMASGGIHMPQDAKPLMFKLLVTLSEILREGSEQKVFKEVNPTTIHFMIMGNINFYVASKPMRSKMTLQKNELNKNFSKHDIKSNATELYNTILASILL
jgi:AcrR family transcriptional regulator